MGGRWSLASHWIDRLVHLMQVVAIYPVSSLMFHQQYRSLPPLFVVGLSLAILPLGWLLQVAVSPLSRIPLKRPKPLAPVPETIKMPVVWPPTARRLKLSEPIAGFIISFAISFYGWRFNLPDLLLVLGFAFLLALLAQVVALRENAGPQTVVTLPSTDLEEARRLLDVSLKKTENKLANSGLTRHDARRLTRWLAFQKR